MKCEGDRLWAFFFSLLIGVFVFVGFFTFLDWWLDNDVLTISEEKEKLKEEMGADVDEAARNSKSFNRIKILVSYMQILATVA